MVEPIWAKAAEKKEMIASKIIKKKQSDYLAARERINPDASVCLGTSTLAYSSNAEDFFHIPRYSDFGPQEREETLKQHCKAENKALLLMQNLIGSEQSDVYRKDHRVILKPNRWFWMIGDVFGSFCEDKPFASKPDVIRIDNPKKLHYTSFCVMQNGGGGTPYTDKVIAFATHLMNDEKAFVKTVNRIREDTLDNMPECAVM